MTGVNEIVVGMTTIDFQAKNLKYTPRLIKVQTPIIVLNEIKKFEQNFFIKINY